VPEKEDLMNGKIIVSTVAVAALVLGNGVLIKSQEAANATAQEGASAQAEVGTQGEALAEGDATTEVTVLASLTAASRENVEVWRLTCTTTYRFRSSCKGGHQGSRWRGWPAAVLSLEARDDRGHRKEDGH